MTRMFWMAAGLLGVGGLAPATVGALAGQQVTYDAPETRALVESMLDAHGGMAAWEARGEAASFTHTMFTPYLLVEGDTRWWISNEWVEHDPQGRVYHEWPIDGARLAFDGDTTWWTDWARPNPAPAMRRTHYNFVFLPWLTQRPGISIARVDDARLPEDEVTSAVVTLTNPGRDRPSFHLYIDPETRSLRGWQMGGALHTVHRWGEAAGIRYPMDWSTRVEGNVIGYHSITGVRIDARIDPSLLIAPPDAETQSGS